MGSLPSGADLPSQITLTPEVESALTDAWNSSSTHTLRLSPSKNGKGGTVHPERGMVQVQGDVRVANDGR